MKQIILLVCLMALALLIPGCSITSNVRQDISITPESKVTPEKKMTKEERIAEARQMFFPHYADRIAFFLDDNPKHAPGGTVFLGDSITEGFPLDKAFPNDNVINRGIGGDIVNGVIKRLDVSVEELQPIKIYLKIGINNINGNNPPTLEELGRQYAELLGKIKACAPKTKVFVQSVLPVNAGFANKNPKVIEFNKTVKSLADKEGYEYIDLHQTMADDQGLLKTEFTFDGIHLNLAGYLAWLEVILPPDKFFESAQALAPEWGKRQGNSYSITAIDPIGLNEYGGSRGPDQLIVYTPKYGSPTTNTNQWGYEAVVQNGQVTSRGGNNSPIPADGYVVSGHGKAHSWIMSKIPIGTEVSLDGFIINLKPVEKSALSTKQNLDSCRSEIMNILADMIEKKASEELFKEAKTILTEIQKLDLADQEPTSQQLDKLNMRIAELNKKI